MVNAYTPLREHTETCLRSQELVSSVTAHTPTHTTLQSAKCDGQVASVMSTSSESPSLPTNAPLLQFTPHAKQHSSKRPTPPSSSCRKHEADQSEVPSFPRESTVQPQKVAAHCLYSSETTPPNRSCTVASQASLARQYISTTVRQHDSRLECGDGDTPCAYMRTSARALAWRRAVGRYCVLCTTRGR